jgi:hypothetical protein
VLPFEATIHFTAVAVTTVVRLSSVSFVAPLAGFVILLIEVNVYSRLTSVDGLAIANLLTAPAADTELALTLYIVLSTLDNYPTLDVLSWSARVIVTTVNPYVAIDGCVYILSFALASEVTESVDHPAAGATGAAPVHKATLFVISPVWKDLAKVCSFSFPMTLASNVTCQASVSELLVT